MSDNFEHKKVKQAHAEAPGPAANFLLMSAGSIFTSMLIAGFIVGYMLDQIFDTTPIFFLSCAVLGFIGGIQKVHTLSKRLNYLPSDEKKKAKKVKRLKMIKSLDKPIKIQGLIGLLMVAIFATQGQAMGAGYGFFVGVMNVLMLSFTFRKANKRAEDDAKAGILILYMSAVIRFVLLAVLFVLGLQVFGFEPMPVVLTFVIMQIGQVFNLKGKQRLTD